MKKRKKVGLVLGSGGARGIAHVGVLKVLEREGIKIDYLVGCSMGSFIGACYALGFCLSDLEKEFKDFEKKRKVIKGLVDFSMKNSILKGEKVYKHIFRLVKNYTFKDLKIPFKIMVTDLENGDEVALSDGDLVKAIQASVSVPGIFPPVEINGRYFIDGGVTNPTPIDVADSMGADLIIGVDFVSQRKKKYVSNPKMMTTLSRTFDIVRFQVLKFKMEKIADKTILIKPKIRSSIDSFKFYNIKKFIQSGEEATEKVLDQIKKEI